MPNELPDVDVDVDVPLLEPANSPLLEADPNSINELISERINEIMNKRPLLLSDDDLRTVVRYYRENRARFILESQTAKAPRARPAGARKPVPKSVAEAINIDPNDLI